MPLYVRLLLRVQTQCFWYLNIGVKTKLEFHKYVRIPQINITLHTFLCLFFFLKFSYINRICITSLNL